jgi:DNA-binding NtrC family response regulator
MEQLVNYQWPGNVRALRHAVERAVILSREEYLTPEDFQLEDQHLNPSIKITSKQVLPQNIGKGNVELPEDSGASSENDLNLDRLEHKTILEALRKNRYVISNAAKDLGSPR